MADAMTLDEYMQSDAGQQLQIDMAGMPANAYTDMMNQLQDHSDAGTLTSDFDTNSLYQSSEDANTQRENAQEALDQQAHDAADGNWSAVQDDAQNAAYDMQAVQDDGGQIDDSQLTQAQTDEANAGWAEYHQEIGDGDATSAAAYAESGDADTAAMYADSAASQDATAAGIGETTEAGGVYADHSVDASASYDASAADASAVDTSAAVDTTPVDVSADATV